MEQYNANDRDGNQIYISPSGAVYRSYDDYALDNGMPTSTGQTDPGMVANQAEVDAQTPTGQTGGGTPAPTFQQYFNGQLFTDAGEYTNAVTQAITKSFNDANAQIQKAYDLGLLDIGQKEEMIKNNRKKALTSIQASFASASPEATQSEQFTSESGANKEAQGNQANLDLYKNSFTLDKENALANNALTMNQNKDTMLNNSLEAAPEGNYANTVAYQAPTLSNNVGTAYSNVSGVAAGGNPAAIKSSISGQAIPENIKTWMYENFLPAK